MLHAMATPWHEMTALALGRAIGEGTIDPVELTEHFLARIAEMDGEGVIYLRPTPERARGEAAAARARARAGLRIGALDGVPMSWKDLYDMAGLPTTGGSPLIQRHPTRDAVVLERATRAGMVCLGKTNTPEFAFSGIGQNPHYGTPANAFDDEVARAPGGSSSGAAISVARGLSPAGIGSDTGGSVRLPAAWNGLAGLKTTVGVLPTEGVVPLSPSFDTVGPLTRDVADANAIFAVLGGHRPADLAGATLVGARLLAPASLMWEDLEGSVGPVARAALETLARAGAEVVHAEVPEFAACSELVAGRGNIISAEGYALWGELLEANPDRVDGSILARFRDALARTSADIEAVHLGLADLRRSYLARTAGFSAVVAPTIPIPPPPLGKLLGDPDYMAELYPKVVRNTRAGNQLDLCALTLPCGLGDGLPVGLMLMAPPRTENALLRLGKAVEAAFAA